MKTARLTRLQVHCAQMLLTFPKTQSRTPEATFLRACLIRQIWWGDRVLALIRDGKGHSAATEQLEANCAEASKAMKILRVTK